MNRLAIGFSGGRSSAVMTRLCLDKYGLTHDIKVIFSNTGCEHPATLDFVRDCDLYWGFNTIWLEAIADPTPGVGISHRVVDYDSASRNGEPFESVIKAYGIPNQTSPHCSGRLKEDVHHHYLKSIGWKRGKKLDHKTAIGIRADEIDRMSQHAERDGIIYPLVEAGITKAKVNEIMSRQHWDLAIPNDAFGNCVWCWKKSDRKLFTVAKLAPEFFSFPARMERFASIKAGEEYKASGPDGLRHLFREHRDVADILRQAESNRSLALYSDANQRSIFDEFLDVGGSCSDGCEIGHS